MKAPECTAGVDEDVAGDAMRQANERARAVRPRLAPRHWAVLSVVQDLTASRGKLQDDIWTGIIATATGYDSKVVRVTLRDLALHGIIEYRPSDGRWVNGKPIYSRIGLPAPVPEEDRWSQSMWRELTAPLGALIDASRAGAAAFVSEDRPF